VKECPVVEVLVDLEKVGWAKVKECSVAPVVNLVKGRAEAPAVVNLNPRS
jgi:hypothetical protein